MNLDELQSVQARERQSSDLQHLRAGFYADVGEYIAELAAERERAVERADDPFSSPEVRQLSDDIETAEGTVEAIYERRVGKVVKKASIAAAGMPVDAEGLTREEEALFEDLVDRIERNRESVLSVLDPDSPADVRTPSADVTDDDTGDLAGADIVDEAGEAAEAGEATGADDVDRADEAGGAGEARETGEADEVDGADETSEARAADEVGASSVSDPARGPGVDDQAVSAADLMGDETPGDVEPARDSQEDPPEETGADRSTGSRQSRNTARDASGGPPGEPATERHPAGSPEDRSADGGSPGADVGDVPGVPRTTVRITADVGEVVGADDRDYDLGAEDVVTLPAPNADVLVEKGAAERLE